MGLVLVPEAHARVALESGIYHHDPVLRERDETLRSPLRAKYRDISMRAGNGERYFISNMAPLAHPSIKDVLPGVSWPDYRQSVIEQRGPALVALIRHFSLRAV